jgi:hypothetical protein
MNKKILLLLLACFTGSLLIIVTLYQLSDKINRRSNGFTRIVYKKVLSNPTIGDLRLNGYYIAGASASHIWLANSSNPALVLETNYAFSEKEHLKILLPAQEGIAWGGLKVAIDSPYIYLSENITPSFLQGYLTGGRLTIRKLQTKFISADLPISPGSWWLRYYDRQLRQNGLLKESLDSPYSRIGKGILKKQIDGFFCTDGMMVRDPASSMLLYIYYYRNQFICMDSNLNLIYRGKTIDTVTQAKIKIGRISRENMVSLAAPPYFVNKKACVSDGLIFINSALLANNEDRSAFEQGEPIDVYALKDGYYRFSFYLFNYKQEKLNNFRICNKKLVAIYGHDLLIYSLYL